MKKICLLVVVILAATALAAQQQNTKPAPQAPSAAKPTPTPAPPPPVARPIPADQKAYMDATRIKDPQKKIEALEKFLEQYPDSFMTSGAHMEILAALIKSQPESKDKILARAEMAMQKAQSPSMNSSNAFNIATHLMKAG